MELPLFAIILDGHFIAKAIRDRKRAIRDSNHDAVTGRDIAVLRESIGRLPILKGYTLLRTCFYDGRPLHAEAIKTPISGKPYDLASDERCRIKQKLHEDIRLTPGMELRLRPSKLRVPQWRLTYNAVSEIEKAPRRLRDSDYILDICQEAVDVQITVDVVQLLSSVRLGALVVGTGDSDFIPILELARESGVKVLLAPLGKSEVSPELNAQSDYLIRWSDSKSGRLTLTAERVRPRR